MDVLIRSGQESCSHEGVLCPIKGTDEYQLALCSPMTASNFVPSRREYSLHLANDETDVAIYCRSDSESVKRA